MKSKRHADGVDLERACQGTKEPSNASHQMKGDKTVRRVLRARYQRPGNANSNAEMFTEVEILEGLGESELFGRRDVVVERVSAGLPFPTGSKLEMPSDAAALWQKDSRAPALSGSDVSRRSRLSSPGWRRGIHGGVVGALWG